MRTVYFVTHPDVPIDPAVPVPDWPLSPRGRERMVRGCERAADTQRRIVAALDHVLAASSGCGGDVTAISHGGVGTLLLCHLRGNAIDRRHDQPPNNGGNHFAFAGTWALHHGWQAIDA